ncbi:MAG: CBS domain-containing protein [Actinomycetota bacterium]|nr:CBS domain-containing protein [Actinomycetota bacterium]
MADVNATRPGRPAAQAPDGASRRAAVGVKVGDLASGDVAAAQPDWTLRAAARCMHERGVGSVVVLEHEELVGILTERDLLRAAADSADLDGTTVSESMTREVVTVAPDWEVYEAAAEMAARHIRHLVVTEGRRVRGVLSIRDLLLAGQRVRLTPGHWAVLRDPLTFTVRERRRLQRCLLELEAGPISELNVDPLIGELVGSWSFDLPLPADAEALATIDPADYELLRAAVIDELPNLQRAVQPAPGWRRWNR